MAVGSEYNGSTTQTLAEDTNGKVWSAVLSPSPGTVSNFLTGASCANATRCIAVGGAGAAPALNGTLVVTGSPLLPGAPTKVKAVAGDASATVSFVRPSFPGASAITGYTVTAADTTAAANGGQTATGPTSPIHVTGLTNGDRYTFTVTATNSAGTGPPSAPTKAVVPYPLTWSSPVSADPGKALESVSCPSKVFCAAVDDKGGALIWEGTAWSSRTVLSSPSGDLSSVSCSSASFCMAVDGDGNAFTYTGTWDPTPTDVIGTSFLYSVSCTSKKVCVATDDGSAAGYNGTRWSAPTDFDGTNAVVSVSCSSAKFCVVVDKAGGSFFYNGVSVSSDVPLGDGTNVPVAVSCPAPKFCMVVDDHGNAIMGST